MASFLGDFTRGARVATTAAAALTVVAAAQAQAAGVPNQGTWQTTLQGRDLDGNAANGFEAYYDTALNLTWMTDANYAQSSGYDADGRMSWHAAKAWVANLNLNGITDWRLPTMVDTGTPGCNWGFRDSDCGYNVSPGISEFAHLYYVTLGNKGYLNESGEVQSGWGLINTGPFKNVQYLFYWFNLEVANGIAIRGNWHPTPSDDAWRFDVRDGSQVFADMGFEMAAWAVHPGDVAAVPEPQTCALALAGLAVAGLARRRRVA
ncbi:MAG: hypothetical protein RI907_1634 [Pseudomonadota bacterium]